MKSMAEFEFGMLKIICSFVIMFLGAISNLILTPHSPCARAGNPETMFGRFHHAAALDPGHWRDKHDGISPTSKQTSQ